MSRFVRAVCVLGALAGAVCLAAALMTRPGEKSAWGAEEAALGADAPKPVEQDMHEFMEYVFEPTYKRLQAHIKAEPADRQAWKAIKADSLILAEGGNLLLFRPSDDETKDWVSHSVAVRELGGQLYAAAGKRDYAAARKSYEAMLLKCNACHDQFAGGEHQLEP